jgi:hypothetical protein
MQITIACYKVFSLHNTIIDIIIRIIITAVTATPIRNNKLLQEWVEWGLRRMMKGVNSTIIFYKNFCKCLNVPPNKTKI